MWTGAAIAAPAAVVVLFRVAGAAAWRRPGRTPAVPGEMREMLDDVEAVRAGGGGGGRGTAPGRAGGRARDRAEDRFPEA